MIVNRRDLQKSFIRLRELACQGKIKIYSQWMENFESYFQWFQSQVINLNDCTYVCDPYIKNWLSTDTIVYYGPETCTVIPEVLFDFIKTIPLCKQIGNIYSPGLAKDKDTGRYKVNYNKQSMGMYDTELQAFSIYKYLKENDLRILATELLNNNYISIDTYNILMQLPILSLRLGINAPYDPVAVSNILQQRASKPKSPIIIDDRKKFNVGTIYYSKYGEPMQILDYNGKFKVTIKFLDWYGYTTVANMDNIRRGSVKNPFRILENGGYFGVGNHVASRDMSVYKTWDALLRRAYMHLNESNKSYINCSVAEEWRNFQVFADWYVWYRGLLNPNYSYQIDKDVLQWGQVNKIYSLQTCCLIPHELNNLLGAIENMCTRPETKDKLITMATEFYNDGAILEDVYKKILSLKFN